MGRMFVVLSCVAGLAWAQIGRLDTVGGTTYDWQMDGPVRRFIMNAPGYGIPVTWIFSASELTTFPDRNMRCNWYDYATRTWLGNDTSDFMNWGWSVFSQRAGCGTLFVGPRDGRMYISAHAGFPLRPIAAREIERGTGLFEFCDGSPELDGYGWPALAVDTADWMHLALIDDASRSMLFYSRCTTWCTWEEPTPLPGPSVGFAVHGIVASLVSRRVIVTCEAGDTVYYWESTDGGTNWLPARSVPPPSGSGLDTLRSFHLGVFPYIDRSDRFHFVADVMPWVGGQGYVAPAEIWHWCRENLPQWSRIVRVDCESLPAPVGYNALYADRPSIGEDRCGGLHVCWEQFDSANVEPGPPELLRADIWYCRDNGDNGASWQEPLRLTVPDSTSKRFPCIYDYAHEDTMRVLYMVDLKAGFFVQGENEVTRNPIVCQHVPIEVGGIKEKQPVARRSRWTGPGLIDTSLGGL